MGDRWQGPWCPICPFLFQLAKLEFQFLELAGFLTVVRFLVAERLSSQSWVQKNLAKAEATGVHKV